MSDTVSAFAGAEGYGENTVGGRGGAVVHVTNLNDSGAGSLRWALETLSGPRTVVFDIGGTISLKSQIMIQNGNVTIAGQTAAGDGITIEGARVRVKASEVVIRGVHFRPGDAPEGQEAGDRDGLMIGTTDFIVRNVIVDHNSFSWAIDENVDINGRIKGLSFTNNIVGEALSRSVHPKGEHSKGLLVSNWEQTADDANSEITIAKNLFTDNMQRNPEVRAGTEIEIVNNYIYNYGLGEQGTSIGGANNGTLRLDVDVIGNVYTPGASTMSVKQPVYMNAMKTGSTITLVDNIITSKAVDAQGDQAQAGMSRTEQKGAPTWTLDYARTGGSDMLVLDSSIVRGYVLANAGAVNGAGHDAVDVRILTEAASGTGRIINATAEVAGVSVSKALVRGAADTDRDGMTDWFEDLYGFNKRVADNNGDNDRDGYTNVEEYINGLISGFDLGRAKTGAAETATAAGVTVKEAALSAASVVTRLAAGGTQKIDLSAVIAGFDPATRTLADYVEIAYANGNSYVSVDADGAGAGTVKTLVAVVDGAKVTSADLVAFAPTVPVVATPQVSVPVATLPVATPAPATAIETTVPVAITPVVATPAATVAAVVVPANTAPVPVTEVSPVTASVVAAPVSATPVAETPAVTAPAAPPAAEAPVVTAPVTTPVAEATPVAAAPAPAPSAPTPAATSTPNDQVYIQGSAGNDTLSVRTAAQRIVEGENGGTDLAVAYVDYTLDVNVENLSLGRGAVAGAGNALANKIGGNDVANTLDGRDGDDSLYGYEGDDTLLGGAGNDWVEGNAGDDRLDGGAGADTLMGGAGHDRFCFTSGGSLATSAGAQDRIADYSAADCISVDGVQIDFSQMASATVAVSRYADAFRAASALVAGGEAFVVVSSNKDSYVFWDYDRDGAIDNGFTMTGASAPRTGWMMAGGYADFALL